MRPNLQEPQNPMLERDPDEPLEYSDNDYQAREARQGRLGRPVLLVLLVGLALAFAVWAAVEFYGQQLPGSDRGGQPQVTTTEPAAPAGTEQPTVDNSASSGSQQTETQNAQPTSGSGNP